MGLIESRKSAISFSRGAIPKEEPMRKQILFLPESFTDLILSASSSEESILPSGVSVQNHAPLGIFVKIKSASFSRPAAISAGEGFSGSRDSGSSRI